METDVLPPRGGREGASGSRRMISELATLTTIVMAKRWRVTYFPIVTALIDVIIARGSSLFELSLVSRLNRTEIVGVSKNGFAAHP